MAPCDPDEALPLTPSVARAAVVGREKVPIGSNQPAKAWRDTVRMTGRNRTCQS